MKVPILMAGPNRSKKKYGMYTEHGEKRILEKIPN
jgi:hypothetical protein